MTITDGLRQWVSTRRANRAWTGPREWTAEDGYNAAVEEVEAILNGDQVAPGLPSEPLDDPEEDEWTNREGQPEFNGSFR